MRYVVIQMLWGVQFFCWHVVFVPSGFHISYCFSYIRFSPTANIHFPSYTFNFLKHYKTFIYIVLKNPIKQKELCNNKGFSYIKKSWCNNAIIFKTFYFMILKITVPLSTNFCRSSTTKNLFSIQEISLLMFAEICLERCRSVFRSYRLGIFNDHGMGSLILFL